MHSDSVRTDHNTASRILFSAPPPEYDRLEPCCPSIRTLGSEVGSSNPSSPTNPDWFNRRRFLWFDQSVVLIVA